MGKKTEAFLMRMVSLSLAIGLSACASPGNGQHVSSKDRAQLLVQVANGALLEGDPTGALENLIRAEKEDPKNPEIYHSKSVVFLMKKDPVQALKEVRRALLLNPDYAEANTTLGKLLLDAGRYEEAEKPLKKAAENPLYRDAYKALSTLGILHYRKANLKLAATYLDRAIEAAPQLACIAYYYRGHVRLRESRFRDAVRDYDQATRRICANFADAHLALGIAYVQNRQYDLARKKFLEVQERFPNTELSDRALGQLRYLP